MCDGASHCPKNEDENLCKHISSLGGSISPKKIICPDHCKCAHLKFKCTSLNNVTKEVRALDLSSNSVEIQYLKNFTFLVYLHLSSSLGATTIFQHFLGNIESAYLQNLDISYNKITHIMRANFRNISNISNLLYLNMSNNKLNVLELGFLSKLPKLRLLILNENEIKTIGVMDKDEVQPINTNLALLDLSGKRLQSISRRALYFLQGLKILILKDNYISNTDYYFSASMKMLDNIDLSRNSINTISSNMFHGLDELVDLNLSENKIKQLDRFTFYSLPALRTLNLAFNKIQTIHELAMENLLSFTELNLTGNNLLHLHSSLFIALNNLKTIDISLNGMQVLENNAFKRLSEVQSLHIQGNDLIVS